MKVINSSETVTTALQILLKVLGVMFGSAELKCFTALCRPASRPHEVIVAIDAKFLNKTGRLHTITPGLVSVYMEIIMSSSTKIGIKVVPSVRGIRVANTDHRQDWEDRDVEFCESGLIRVYPDTTSNRIQTCLVGYSSTDRWMEPLTRMRGWHKLEPHEIEPPDFQI